MVSFASSQLSTVQATPSSTAGGVPATQPLAGSQVSSPLQKSVSSQTSGVPGVQCAVWQSSAPLQALPSLQDVPSASAGLLQPRRGAQTSLVQTLPSLQAASEVQPRQTPSRQLVPFLHWWSWLQMSA